MKNSNLKLKNMKTFYLNLIWMLFLSFNTIAQENYTTDYKIEYELKFSMDTTNLEHTKTEKMYLFTGSEYGVFINEFRVVAEKRLAELQNKGSSGHVSFG